MYSYIMAVCLALDVSGEPKNPCWMTRGDEIYRTMAACQSAATKKEKEMSAFVADEYDVAGVVDAPCGEYTGE